MSAPGALPTSTGGTSAPEISSNSTSKITPPSPSSPTPPVTSPSPLSASQGVVTYDSDDEHFQEYMKTKIEAEKKSSAENSNRENSSAENSKGEIPSVDGIFHVGESGSKKRVKGLAREATQVRQEVSYIFLWRISSGFSAKKIDGLSRILFLFASILFQ